MRCGSLVVSAWLAVAPAGPVGCFGCPRRLPGLCLLFRIGVCTRCWRGRESNNEKRCGKDEEQQAKGGRRIYGSYAADAAYNNVSYLKATRDGSASHASGAGQILVCLVGGSFCCAECKYLIPSVAEARRVDGDLDRVGAHYRLIFTVRIKDKKPFQGHLVPDDVGGWEVCVTGGE